MGLKDAMKRGIDRALGRPGRRVRIGEVTDLSTLEPGDIVYVESASGFAFGTRIEGNDGKCWIVGQDQVYSYAYAQPLIDSGLVTVLMLGRTDAALSLARGMANAANSEVVDLGDFAQYAD